MSRLPSYLKLGHVWWIDALVVCADRRFASWSPAAHSNRWAWRGCSPTATMAATVWAAQLRSGTREWRVQLGCAVTEPDPDQRRLTLTRTDGTAQQLPYDMLHLVRRFANPTGSPRRWCRSRRPCTGSRIERHQPQAGDPESERYSMRSVVPRMSPHPSPFQS